jgi:antibiotic biosynthesis monooxygenase (ABM) superfamily enzyme
MTSYYIRKIRRMENETGVANAWALMAAVSGYVGAQAVRKDVLDRFTIEEIATFQDYESRIFEDASTQRIVVLMYGRSYSFSQEDVDHIVQGPVPMHGTLFTN